jgi:hypothetical protein
MSTNNNTQNQSQRNNPFASRSANNQRSGSPFGSSSSSSSRFGSSRLSRFGRTTLDWTILPLHDRAVRFSVEGLGDPFQRLLGMPLDVEMRSVENVLKRLQSDKELAQRLQDVLDEIWASYEFQGAALLMPDEEGIRRAYVDAIQPTAPPPQKEQSDDDDDEEYIDEDAEPPTVKPDVTRLRAIDLGLVLNVLGRSRANVLVGNTPLALEAAFLQQTFICDDPRIVAIAEATGSIEDTWE